MKTLWHTPRGKGELERQKGVANKTHDTGGIKKVTGRRKERAGTLKRMEQRGICREKKG